MKICSIRNSAMMWILFFLPCLSIATAQVDWFNNMAFRSALDKSADFFFGTHIGSFMGYGLTDIRYTPAQAALVKNQFRIILDGIPEGDKVLPNGKHLYAFAKPHDAQNMAAVVTAEGSTNILAAAIVHQSCGRLDVKATETNAGRLAGFKGVCGDHWTLSIFFADNASHDREIQEELIAWARTHYQNFRYQVLILKND